MHSDTALTYYQATACSETYPELQGVHSADVCIIGGGFTGINTALELAERGLSVILLEARRIGWGASGRNGGQLIRGLGHDVEQFRHRIGDEGVQQLKQLGFQAVDKVRQRIERHRIDCDLQWGYCDLATRPRHLEALAEEQAELQALGYPFELRQLSREQLPEVIGSDRYLGGLIDPGSGHLHPLKLLQGETRAARSLGVAIHEQSPVQRIEYGPTLTLHTTQGQVRASTLVLACNAYIGRLQPWLAGKVLPAGSYLIATEPLPNEVARRLLPGNHAVCDQRVVMDYFRLSADKRLLFGGACHYSGRDPRDIAAYMRPRMLKVFPELRDTVIEYHWAGMIGIGANRLPQLGQLPGQANVYYAQAYAGHGLNVTHLTGQLLAEAIARQQSSGFELLARIPHRTFPGGPALRSPLLALGMLWHRLLDLR